MADIPAKLVRVTSQFRASGADPTHDFHPIERYTSEFLDQLFIDFIQKLLQRELTTETAA